MVESGDADVVVVAYLDRLVRSLTVQSEVVGRVEAAGGAILAVDVGQVTNGSAGQWLSGTLLGAVSEYARRVTAERTADAKRRAVERGVPPFPNFPPGLRQRDDGRLEPHPDEATVVADAFQLRADGATVKEVREFLRARGIERSFHGTQALLTSRIVLGELRFGALVNPNAHPAIVDPVVWQKVQRMRSPRGRRPKSERLLARLGVLRCATCGGRMVIGSTDQNGKRHYFYRCSPVGDCPRRVTISADVAEQIVVERVRELTEGIQEGTSLADEIAAAERDADAALQRRDAMIAILTGLEDVDAAREQIQTAGMELRQAEERATELRAAAAPALTVSTTGSWDDLSFDERRALIRAVVASALVAPGRGPRRVTVYARETLDK
jgi:hypothetical protein